MGVQDSKLDSDFLFPQTLHSYSMPVKLVGVQVSSSLVLSTAWGIVLLCALRVRGKNLSEGT